MGVYTYHCDRDSRDKQRWRHSVKTVWNLRLAAVNKVYLSSGSREMACLKSSSAASSEYPGYFDVLFICDEWGSSRGGMSTFNREFAINLAKATTNSMKIHCYVSKSDERDREDARQQGVNLITAQCVPGSADSLDWLKIPPPGLQHPDVVVGHGRKFGTPAYFIMQTTKCKWVQFVHVFCEDLGKYKKTGAAAVDTIEENEKKHKMELQLCRAADAVVAVGSRLQQKLQQKSARYKGRDRHSWNLGNIFQFIAVCHR